MITMIVIFEILIFTKIIKITIRAAQIKTNLKNKIIYIPKGSSISADPFFLHSTMHEDD
jgi:hypothetical protein